MKHAVSVSLGSKRRNTDQVITLLGEEVRIERRGVDGDVRAARALIASLDGHVDAIGLGGIDLYLRWGSRRYHFREARHLAAAAPRTPVVCGAGLKHTLERRTIDMLDASVGWRARRVLLTSAVDRFGMAEALMRHGADLRFGDLAFAFGVPLFLRSARALDAVARTVGPVAVQLPVKWIYSTGGAQDRGETTERYAAQYHWAQVIAGDWHMIRRFAPARMDGVTVLTNTTTREDVAFLRDAGAARLVTTTPRYGGRSLATNLLEAALVAVTGGHLDDAAFASALDAMAYAPTEIAFDEA
ncbi:MAG: quinate 5-dehydrogenase [Trueperaceae bacterium]|nr:MAG: quinate 5-dehydrogenase [Trueperaceae bacterium]